MFIFNSPHFKGEKKRQNHISQQSHHKIGIFIACSNKRQEELQPDTNLFIQFFRIAGIWYFMVCNIQLKPPKTTYLNHCFVYSFGSFITLNVQINHAKLLFLYHISVLEADATDAVVAVVFK